MLELDEKITLEELPEFLNQLMSQELDYESVVDAVAMGMKATMAAMNNHEKGNLKTFQRSCVMWKIIEHINFRSNKCGGKLISYDNMLFPQFERFYEKTITSEEFSKLQEEAKNKLADKGHVEFASKNVLMHWVKIVKGEVPFGYKIYDEKY